MCVYVCVCVCVCACVCVCVCVCLLPFTVKALSVWISWNVREQINDVLLKKFLSSTLGWDIEPFYVANLSCSHTRNGQSPGLASVRLAFKTWRFHVSLSGIAFPPSYTVSWSTSGVRHSREGGHNITIKRLE